jgi:hypothetical protein
LEQCTFRPSLQAKYKSSKLEDRSPDKRKPDQIFEELYKKKEKKDDVKTEDIEFQKNVGECTFKPDIKNSLKRVSKYGNTSAQDIKRGGSPDPKKDRQKLAVAISNAKAVAAPKRPVTAAVKKERQVIKPLPPNLNSNQQ